MKLSTPRKFIIESILVALLMTSLPVALLVWLGFNRLTTPLNMVVWLVAALGWTALVVVVYVKRSSRRGGIVLKS
ncbi:MAG: hypothetical protein NZ570_05360 [Candidatus Caldarchaeum sp.]|nr:hypothetical protein [Candidatus Caldarchaeum sp.]MCS7138101.1 hypothetical protein [Candidatus Caldarchaeum sp.]MDW7978288.1 hypothetical protein [Candidatus Caldarchaeum sp.]MDW8359313.1 hypothetical protein [Candidatus Caldarchaeum sp.]